MHLKLFLHATAGKRNAAGTYPIKAALDLNGKRYQFSLGLQTLPEYWCAHTERVLPDDPQAGYINECIARVYARYHALRVSLEQKRQTASLDMVKSYLLEREESVPTIEKLYAAFLQRYEDLLKANRVTAGTATYYKYKLSALRKYWKHKRIDYASEVTPAMQEDMYLFFAQYLSNNTALQTVQAFRMFLAFCLEQGRIDRMPFGRLRHKIERKEIIYLTQEEMEALRGVALSAKLAKSRDCFLLSCLTGLSYSDLRVLSKAQIVAHDGREYIYIKRTKTDVEGYVPVLEETSELLKRYGYELRPPDEPRTYNNHLRKIFALAGIPVHKAKSRTGRKTFGNRMLNMENVPLEVVSTMMCHAKVTTTQHYYVRVRIGKVGANTAHIK